MLCPECGLEYEDSTSHCPDCEVLLVGELEEAVGPAEFLPLIEVTDATAFALVTSQLEEQGIPWFIQSEPPLGLPAEPGGPVAVVYVAEACLDQARAALERALIGVGEQI